MSYYFVKDYFDGYLCWVYNSWLKELLFDLCFEVWVGGDIYLVYLGVCFFICFEKLIEGVQVYEKIMIFCKEFMDKKNKIGFKKLEKMFFIFNLRDFFEVLVVEIVNKVNKILNLLQNY